MTDVVRDRFRPEPSAAAEVRRFLRSALRGVRVPCDEVVLAANELAINAIRHARTLFDVIVERREDCVRVAVLDGDGTIPTCVDAPEDATGGRGLALVDATADEWGVRPAPPGKVVWFTRRVARS